MLGQVDALSVEGVSCIGGIVHDPFLDLAAGHAENAVRIGAEGFVIGEVSPAADALSQQKAHCNNIQHRHQLHLSELCHQSAHQ